MGFLRECLRKTQIYSNVFVDTLKRITPNYLSSIQALSASLAPLTEQITKIHSTLPDITLPTSVTLSRLADLTGTYQNISAFQNINDTVRLISKNLENNPTDTQDDEEDGE